MVWKHSGRLFAAFALISMTSLVLPVLSASSAYADGRERGGGGQQGGQQGGHGNGNQGQNAGAPANQGGERGAQQQAQAPTPVPQLSNGSTEDRGGQRGAAQSQSQGNGAQDRGARQLNESGR